MKSIKNKIFNKKNTSITILLILSVILLLIARLIATPKDTRERAAGSARLFFNPPSSVSNPIQKKVNQTITLVLTLDPGQAVVSFVRFDVLYDQSKFSVNGPTAIQINSSVFPVTFEGPILTPGRVAASVSVGNDPTKVVSTLSTVANITFTALSDTGVPSQIRYGDASQVLSIGAGSSASENVLGTREPAYILVGQPGANTATPDPNITSSPTPTTDPIVTSIPSLTLAPTLVFSPTPIDCTKVLCPTLNPNRTTLALNLLFHGIGSGGDSSNPNTSDLSNKNPIHQERMLNIQLVNEDNQIVATKLAPAFYNSQSGVFISNVVINDPLAEGDYVVKVKTDPYLRKLMPGFLTIKPGKKNTMSLTELVTGDINGDNVINALDYNILYDCGYGVLNPLPMIHRSSAFMKRSCRAHTEKSYADLNDNGTIDAADYNLFIRELAVGFGN